MSLAHVFYFRFFVRVLPIFRPSELHNPRNRFEYSVTVSATGGISFFAAALISRLRKWGTETRFHLHSCSVLEISLTSKWKKNIRSVLPSKKLAKEFRDILVEGGAPNNLSTENVVIRSDRSCIGAASPLPLQPLSNVVRHVQTYGKLF